MGQTAESVVVELQARVDKYARDMDRARRKSDQTFDGIARGASSAETQSAASLSRISDRISRFTTGTQRSIGLVRTGLAGLFAGFGAALGVRGLIAVADAAKQLDAQLKLATASSGNFAVAQDDVRRIANETRAGLSETANLYASFQRNAAELGITQEQAARATETVAKAFKISGASAAEAAGGLRQFLQGVQSGTLRGEELNSVLENAPRLARLIADSLNITIGQLRALGAEGKISGDKLMAALTDQKFTAAIDQEFKQIPVTFSDAMQLVSNAAMVTFSAFDSGGEFSSMLANFVTGGSQGFADLEDSAFAMGVEIRSIMDGLSDVFEPMLQGALGRFDIIRSEAHGLRNAIADILGAIDNVRNAVPSFANRIRQNGRNAGIGFLFRQDDPMSDLRGGFLRGQQRSERARIQKEIMSPDATARTLAEFGGSTRAQAPRAASSGGGGKAKKGRAGPSAESIARKEEQREAAFHREMEQIDRALSSARRSLVTSAEALDDFDKARIEQERQDYAKEIDAKVKKGELRDQGIDSEAAQLRAKNDLRAQLETELVDRRAAERHRQEAQAAEERKLELSQGSIRNEEDLLRSRADLATSIKARRDIELRLIDLQFREERIQNDAIIAKAAALDAIKDKTEAEKRAAEAARVEADLAQQRNATLPERQANAQQGTRDANLSPLDQWAKTVPQTAQQITEALEGIAANGLEGLNAAITGVITGTQSLKEAFSNLAKSIIADIIQMTIRMLIFKAISGVIGKSDGGPVSAGSVGQGASIVGGAIAKAGGGAIFGPGTGTSDSIPAWLSNGEYVVRAKAVKALGIPFLDALNKGRLPHFSEGGLVRSVAPLNSAARTPGGGMVVHQHFTLDARYGITTPEFIRSVDRKITERAGQAGQAAFDASQKAVPGRLQRFQKLGG